MLEGGREMTGGALAAAGAATSVTTASAFCAGHAMEPGATDMFTTCMHSGGKLHFKGVCVT